MLALGDDDDDNNDDDVDNDDVDDDDDVVDDDNDGIRPFSQPTDKEVKVSPTPKLLYQIEGEEDEQFVLDRLEFENKI